MSARPASSPVVAAGPPADAALGSGLPTHVIQAPAGLPGFESCRRYALVEAAEIAPFIGLHGLDAPHPRFLTVDSRRLEPDYHVPLGASDRSRLGVTGDEPLLWLAIVTVTETTATANLRAPVVVHPTRMTAVQVVDHDVPYSSAHPLLD